GTPRMTEHDKRLAAAKVVQYGEARAGAVRRRGRHEQHLSCPPRERVACLVSLAVTARVVGLVGDEHVPGEPAQAGQHVRLLDVVERRDEATAHRPRLTTRWQRALEPADAGGVTDDGFDGDAS